MALTEALSFLVTADSSQAIAEFKKLDQATKTVAELEARLKRLSADKSAGGLANYARLSGPLTSALTQARGNLDALTASTGRTSTAADKLKGAFAQGLGIGSGIAALQTGVGLVKELGSALVDASKLAEQDARSQFTLNQAIKNNTDAGLAGAASGEAYVQSLQKQAAIADDELRPALATLVRSTNDVTEAQKLLGLAADVAAGTGTDVGSVADALAKSYQGNTKSLKALAPEVSKLIKDGASASEIFSKLTAVYAGSAKGLADVSPWQRLNVQIEESKEKIGAGLLPAVSGLGDALTNTGAVDAYAAELSLIGQAARDSIGPVKDLIGLIGSIPGVPSLKGAFGVDEGDGILKRVAALRDLSDAVQSGKVKIQDLIPAVASLPPYLQALADKFAGVKPKALDAGDGLDDFATRVKNAQAALSGVNSQIFGISDAQSALAKSVEDSSSAANSAASRAKAYASALRRVDDTTRSLADAQDALQEAEIKRFVTGLGASSDEVTSAQIAERESTRSLANAKLDLIDAEEALRRLQNGGAAASRLEAQANLLDANKALADAQSSGDPSALLKAKAALIKAQQGIEDTSSAKQAQNLTKAQDAVAAAQDDVTKAAIGQRTAQRDLNDTLIRGKEGSRELAEANKEVESAQRRVEDATRSLDDAQDGVQDALANTASATKSASDRFESGRSAAQAYIDYLAKNGGTPADFAKAIGDISTALGGVATEAGKTGDLDAYLAKLRETAGLLLTLNNAPVSIPGSSGSSANAVEHRLQQQQTINLLIDGKNIATAVVDQSVAQGGLPIIIKAR